MAYWWVNQKQTYRAEREGGYLWAPLVDARGRPLSHWETMAKLRPNDVVFHHARGIRAVGVVAAAAVPAPMPPDLPDMWDRDGRIVRVDYADVLQPVRADEIPLARRITERGPFASTGRVNQGYLYSLSLGFAEWLLATYSERFGSAALDAKQTSETDEEVGAAAILPSDPELRRKVENYAVDVVMAALQAEYGAERVRKMPQNNRGYDIQVDRSPVDPPLHVEVKGTQRAAPVFLMSETERAHSAEYSDHYELRVVWQIDLTRNDHAGVERRVGEVAVDTHGLAVQRWQGRLVRSH